MQEVTFVNTVYLSNALVCLLSRMGSGQLLHGALPVQPYSYSGVLGQRESQNHVGSAWVDLPFGSHCGLGAEGCRAVELGWFWPPLGGNRASGDDRGLAVWGGDYFCGSAPMGEGLGDSDI